MTILNRYFVPLRAMGGEADSRVVLELAKVQPGTALTRYSSIKCSVVLLIPFTFCGRDLTSVVEGTSNSEIQRTVTGIHELNQCLSTMRVQAFQDAVAQAVQDIPGIMFEVRQTVSARKILKKIRATMNRFDAWKVLNSHQQVITIKLKETS